MQRISGGHGLPQAIWANCCPKAGLISTQIVLALLCLLVARPVAAIELTLSDFNGTGFDYTFGGFSQTIGPNSVRLRDLVDDSGGAGKGQSLNLTSHADSRFVVDLFKNPGNGVDKFDLELIDSMGRTGKWTLGVSNLDVGVPSTLVSATTLANPTHGIGDFANLDLNNITAWQVLGTFQFTFAIRSEFR